MDYSLLIKNGLVVDGTGAPGRIADVGIRGERIAVTGSLGEATAAKTIDAAGKVVCPGFIDTHSHSELALLGATPPEPKVRQGVTTELLGQDGMSVAPIRTANRPYMKEPLTALLGNHGVDWDWESFGEYLDRLAARGIPLNAACLAPHGSVRMEVLGMDNRAATEEELRRMRGVLARVFEEGAFGLSTGLIYPPCTFADRRELVALNEVVAEHGGCFVVHVRNESNRLLDSMAEVVGICREAKAALHVSHLKASGRANWGQLGKAIEMFERGRAEGMDITCDQYPYTAGCTVLTALLPPWALAGGKPALFAKLRDPAARANLREEFKYQLPGWDNRSFSVGWDKIMIASVETGANKWMEGQMIAAIADRLGQGPVDTVFDILLAEDAVVTMVLFQGSEDDLREGMGWAQTMVATDGIYGRGKPHPRLYGTYPRVLGKYVREDKVLTMEEAIHKMTTLPASRLGLSDRGRLAPGYYADVVVFDPATVLDRGTYEDPHQYPDGIDAVCVNGALAVERGAFTGTLAGKVLRKS